MPRVITNAHKVNKISGPFVAIYVATLLLVFHTFVVAYINSSFLEQFMSAEAVGTMYIIGSLLTVAIFLFISRVLHLVGNFRLTLAFILMDFFAVFGMSVAQTLEVAVPLFLVHLIIVALIVLNLDVFLEEYIGNDEGITGSRRGFIMSITSIVGALSPFISGNLVVAAGGTFEYVYIASALSLLPIAIILIWFFRDFRDPPYKEIKVLSAIRSFWIRPSIRAVFIAHFILQIFFVCTVVFIPLYLTKEIGLSWQDFGIIMIFGQLAYVLFEYPIGIVADKYIGEKEMMAFGFLILAISIAWIAFVTVPSVFVWSIIMFVTRVGVSFVQVTTESYFFKQTSSSDAQVISFFRITRPLAFAVGAIISSLTLLYLPFNLLFIVIATLMVPALFFTLEIKDTK